MSRLHGVDTPYARQGHASMTPTASTQMIDLWELDSPVTFTGDPDWLPTITISVGRGMKITLVGADLSADSRGVTRVTCRHPHDTDDEHDRIYLARLEFAGLTPQWVINGGLSLAGHLIAGSFYSDDNGPRALAEKKGYTLDTCTDCETEHTTNLPYQPPEMAIKPVWCDISVVFPGAKVA